MPVFNLSLASFWPPKSRSSPPVRTPTVLQLEATECGAASLSIVLQHYGRYVPLTELREACGVSRDGSDAASMLRAAERYGLKGKGFRKSLERLQIMTMPVVIFWEFNHFLVLEGFANNKAWLNDPAQGRRCVAMEDFDTSYTGVALELRPTEQFVRGGRRPSVWPIVLRRLATEPAGVLFMLLTGLLLIVPQLLMPVFSQLYIDEVVGNGFQSWLKPMLLAMATTIALLAIGTRLRLLGIQRLNRRLDVRFSVDFQRSVLSLPERFYRQRFAGDIAERTNTNRAIADFITGQLLPLITDQLLLVFYLILTMLYSPVLGAIVISTSLINAISITKRLRVQNENSQILQKNGAKGSATIVAALRDIETVKASAVEDDVFRRFSGYESKSLVQMQRFTRINAAMEMLPVFLSTLNEISVLLVGFLLVLQGKLTLGMLLAAQMVAMELGKEIEKTLTFLRGLPTFEASLLRLEDVIEQPLDPLLLSQSSEPAAATSASREGSRLSGAIEIVDLSFGYFPTKPPLINGLNLSVAPGQRIALVGSSGSGKSSVVRVLSGLYEPTRGEVLFDGRPLAQWPRGLAVGSVAMVQQEIQLFGCSVIDNLTLWDPTIPHEQVVNACRDAQILETIQRLPQGFDTVMAEGGRSFSGGQRQRLEIARALVGDPSILVLDEATSALDPETERLVDAALRRRGCTQILVAHRLSTIRDADRILVMEAGKVVQEGTHEQMLSEPDSPYRRLLDMA
jgi:NHLM bacteriocin system ABC transporter peptidase/ATP-binding protein